MADVMHSLAQTFVDSTTGTRFERVDYTHANVQESSPGQKRSPSGGSKQESNHLDKSDILSISDTTLAETYKFEREVGYGNWGSVWSCKQKTGDDKGRTVAIKLVHRSKNTTASSARVKALWREYKCVRAMAEDPHPTIISFHSFVLTPSYAIIAMDFHPKLMPIAVGEAKARDYFIQLVDCVDWLHERGFSHCDIKPSNILLSADDRPILVDFGFATFYPADYPDRFTSCVSWGTPEYLDPLRARGKRHDERAADIWALGVTMYEIVVGRTPFERTEKEEFLTRSALEVYYDRTLTGQFLGDYHISADFEDLIHKMVEPDLALRLAKCGSALSHPWFYLERKKPASAVKRSLAPSSPVYTTTPTRPHPQRSPLQPVKSIHQSATPVSKAPRSVKRAGHRDSLIQTYDDDVASEFAPKPVSSTIPSPTASFSSLPLTERTNDFKLNQTNSSGSKRARAPAAGSRPLSAATASRIPVRSVSDTTIKAPRTVADAQRQTSQSAVRSIARKPLPKITTVVASPTPQAKPNIRGPLDAVTPSASGQEVHKQPCVIETTFPASATFDVARDTGRDSPMLSPRASSTSLSSKLHKGMRRAPSVLSFNTKKPELPSAGPQRRASISASPNTDAQAPPNASRNLDAEKSRLEAFSQHLQQLIDARKPAQPSTSLSAATRRTPRSASDTTGSLAPKLETRCDRVTGSENGRSRDEPITTRPERPGSVSKVTTATKMRPSLTPSLVAQATRVSPPAHGSPRREGTASKASPPRPGHRRVPTNCRIVPPILLHESESESETSNDAESPQQPKIVEEGRQLPTWVPNVVDSDSNTDGEGDEPTVTLISSPRSKRSSTVSGNLLCTSFSPSLSAASTTSPSHTRYRSEPVDLHPRGEARAHSRTSSFASATTSYSSAVRAHKRSLSVMTMLFSSTSSKASVVSRSAADLTLASCAKSDSKQEKGLGGTKKGIIRRAVRKFLK